MATSAKELVRVEKTPTLSNTCSQYVMFSLAMAGPMFGGVLAYSFEFSNCARTAMFAVVSGSSRL